MAKKKIFGIPKMLSDGIGETINTGNSNIGQLRYEIISINRIALDENNPRDLFIDKYDVLNGISNADLHFQKKQDELSSLETLSFSIKKAGIRNPIEVYKNNETYKLISGERRVLASLLAGKTDIPAKILDSKPDELQLRFLQWIENIERQDLTIWERLHNVEQLITAYKSANGLIDEHALSDVIGCSIKQSKRYLDVISAPPALRNAMREAGISDLIKLSMIINTPNQAIQLQLITEAANGASRENISSIIKDAEFRKKSHSNVEKKGRGRPKTSISLRVPVQKISSMKYLVEYILGNPILEKHKSKFHYIDWENESHIKKAFDLLLDVVQK